MVEKQRPRSGSKFSLKPQIAAVLSALPPLGYKAPPPLIGGKTMSPDTLALRARNYAKAYKTLSVKDWNSYAVFGLQQFASPSKYLTIRNSETEKERNLRLGRYYRLHLEHKAPVDKFLMSQIVGIAGIEAALQTSFPGYFDMSTVEMDEYLQTLCNEDLQIPDEHFGFSPPTETDSIDLDAVMTSTTSESNTAASHMNVEDVAPALKPAATQDSTSSTQVSDLLSQGPPALTGDFAPISQDFPTGAPSTLLPVPSTRSSEQEKVHLDFKTPDSPLHNRKRHTKSSKTAMPQAVLPSLLPALTPPSIMTASARIEARWAPKDFHALKTSTAKMYTRLAPLLSCFNTCHSWLIEWQTDQLALQQKISPAQLSKFLSIRVVPVPAQQCFYFSFRVNATGKQLVQVLQSKELKKTKRGENLTLDPSFIPTHHGELVNIGDILHKDASVTHRSHYVKYLRSEVLPPDTPEFELKVRHKDPAGKKTPILTVRCGKCVSVAVAQMLSTSLNGEGTNPEIFISRLALGANQVAKGDHEQIYKVHHEYLADVKFIPLTASRLTDLKVIEHLESGENVNRSPRQWAKSLIDSNGQSLEVDLEHGTIDGSAVLITPSASYSQTLLELKKYWQRQNPALATAAKMYNDTVREDPNIPITVFTRNIETILAKKIKKSTSSVRSDDAATFLSPESSITGTTAKSSKGHIAWQVPLQETIQRQEYKKASKKANRISSRDLAQQQRIASLEAQLASMSSANSKTSSTTERSKRSQSRASQASSQLSGNSPTLTIASAHARLDGIETAVQNIQSMLSNLTARVQQPQVVEALKTPSDPTTNHNKSQPDKSP